MEHTAAQQIADRIQRQHGIIQLKNDERCHQYAKKSESIADPSGGLFAVCFGNKCINRRQKEQNDL